MKYKLGPIPPTPIQKQSNRWRVPDFGRHMQVGRPEYVP